MNENAYKQTYHEVNQQRCVFEKMILLRYAACQQSEKLLLAEREAMSCVNEQGSKNCQYLLNLTRQNARFSLQITKANAPLPHSQELKVQAGSLYGLQQYLKHKDTSNTLELADEVLKFDNTCQQPISNIIDSINTGLKRFGKIEEFPFTEMIMAIMNFSIPKRKRKSKKK